MLPQHRAKAKVNQPTRASGGNASQLTLGYHPVFTVEATSDMLGCPELGDNRVGSFAAHSDGGHPVSVGSLGEVQQFPAVSPNACPNVIEREADVGSHPMIRPKGYTRGQRDNSS
jgi:hypothetical protein